MFQKRDFDNAFDKPQIVLMLDQLRHVPETGDVLHMEDHSLAITEVNKQRPRSCLTGRKLSGHGNIAVLVNERVYDLKPLARHPNLLWVKWTPKDELPWHF